MQFAPIRNAYIACHTACMNILAVLIFHCHFDNSQLAIYWVGFPLSVYMCIVVTDDL